jgi:hypothetical protein
MKTKPYIRILLISACFIFSAINSAQSAFTCDEDAQQASGSIYRICMPSGIPYNGKLVIWAHGFQDAGRPISIPEDQLSFGDFSIPDVITSLGYGFATNSYSKTGLAVENGMADIIDLLQIYKKKYGEPEKVFLTGASEGGLITALLTESEPNLFDAGLAACGPVGDFPYQLRYFGDARATFQFFFPRLIPGDPFKPDVGLVNNWKVYYETIVKPSVFASANRSKLDQWVKVANLPFDENDYITSLETTVADVLRYSVVNINDATTTLGGFPFENRWTWYRGSNNDFLLNLMVPRRAASTVAVERMKDFYNTSGKLEIPLITIHTIKDQQVPYLHESLYNLKTLSSGSLLTEHINIPINRYGHCNFKPEEALLGFGLMLLYAGEMDTLEGVGSLLRGSELTSFEKYADQYGLPYNAAGERLLLK